MSRFYLLLLALLSFADAQETLFRQVIDEKSNTYLEATALFSEPSLGGYHPIRIVIENNQNTAHKIFLKCNDKATYLNDISTSSSFTFNVEPGKTLTQDILVPLCPQNSFSSMSYFTVSLSGSMGENEYSKNGSFSPDYPIVLLSDTLFADNASSLDSSLSSRGLSSYRGSSSFASSFNAKQTPDDWRAYSGYDSIIMTDNDWLVAPPGARNAILSWLRLGGQLIIYSQTSITPASLGIPADPSFGKVIFKPISADLRMKHAETVDLVLNSRSGEARIKSLTTDYSSTWKTQGKMTPKTFNSTTFVIVLIVFGILVGPVNLFVFAKSGKRHRLFVTTPVISVVTSLILILLIIFQDGFGGEGERLVLMEIRPDESQNAAYIHQEQFSRTGVMTSSNFTMEDSALISPVAIAPTRWSRFTNDQETAGNYDIQMSGGKTIASGSWFQSRSEQGHAISAVVPTRGRIEATSSPDTIVSTFDFPIKTLLYKDPSGNWYRASEIQKGAKTKLTPIDATMANTQLSDFQKLFADRNGFYLKQVSNRNDHFIAETTNAPGIETNSSIDWKTTTIITGPLAR